VKIAWSTDPHFNFVGRATVREFCARVASSGAQALLLGGDLAEAATVKTWLHFVADQLDLPVYFVLGNHDYYGSSVAAVREQMNALDHQRLRFLDSAGVVPLSPTVALVGNGGWGDGRLGDFAGSDVVLNDYLMITELRCAGSPGEPLNPLSGWQHKGALAARLGQLGDQCAAQLRPALEQALERYEEVVVLTHVPPFKSACWHQGKLSADDWLPGFTCQAMGELLSELAESHPQRQLTVLCGHTHSEGRVAPSANMTVATGAARYGHPAFKLLEW
jgi:predicted phosphohydrolase